MGSLTVRESLDEIYCFENPWFIHGFPFISCAVYLLMLVILPKILIAIKKQNPPEDIQVFVVPGVVKGKEKTLLNWCIFFHNVFLCVGSVFGFVMGAVPAMYLRYSLGYINVVCDPAGRTSLTPHFNTFSICFALSKYYELLDTFFLIVKKPERPIKFLHWYHHVTVLIFTWYAIVYHYSGSYIFAFVNLFIHSLMYFYYSIATFWTPPKWGNTLTILQMVQMIMGLFFLLSLCYYMHIGYRCFFAANPIPYVIYGLVMYASYLFLFFQFFMAKNKGRRRRKRRGGEKTKEAEATDPVKHDDGNLKEKEESIVKETEEEETVVVVDLEVEKKV